MTKSQYQRAPNENWLQAHKGETIVLQFPFGEYAVTVHSQDPEELRSDNSNEAPAND